MIILFSRCARTVCRNHLRLPRFPRSVRAGGPRGLPARSHKHGQVPWSDHDLQLPVHSRVHQRSPRTMACQSGPPLSVRGVIQTAASSSRSQSDCCSFASRFFFFSSCCLIEDVIASMKYWNTTLLLHWRLYRLMRVVSCKNKPSIFRLLNSSSAPWEKDYNKGHRVVHDWKEDLQTGEAYTIKMKRKKTRQKRRSIMSCPRRVHQALSSKCMLMVPYPFCWLSRSRTWRWPGPNRSCGSTSWSPRCDPHWPSA